MIQHKGPISGVATYGNQWVATAGYDNQIILWEASSKKSVARAFHDHLVNACAFSTDGKKLVTASSDHTARIYRVPDLKLEGLCSGHNDDVEMAVFNEAGTLVATASRDNFVRLFKTTGELVATMKGHEADVLSVAFEAGDKSLVSTSDDGTLRRWSLAGEQIEMMDLGGVETDTLAILPNGNLIAGNDDGEMILLGKQEARTIKAHRAGIKRLVFETSTSRLVSVSYDRSAKLWRVSSSGQVELICEFNLPNLIWPRSCAFLGESIVFGTFGSSFARYDIAKAHWDLSTIQDTIGKNAVNFQNGETYSIGDSGVLYRGTTALAPLGSLCNFVLPVNGFVLTAGQSGEVFEGFSGKVLIQHTSPLNCGAQFVSNGETYAVIGAYTGEILLFQVSGSSPRFLKTFKVHENAIKGISASNCEVFTVCANREAARVSIESLLSAEPTVAWKSGEAHDKIANGCCSLSEKTFASISRDLKLRIWHEDGCEVIPTPHTHSIKCIAADTEGRYIATGSYNGMVAVFDSYKKSWTKVCRPTTHGISSLCANGSGFLSSSYDGGIYEI